MEEEEDKGYTFKCMFERALGSLTIQEGGGGGEAKTEIPVVRLTSLQFL